MATCDHDIQLIVSQPARDLLQPSCGRRHLIPTEGYRRSTGKDGQLLQVRGDPTDPLEQLFTDQADPTLVDERRPGGGAQHRVENNPFPRIVLDWEARKEETSPTTPELPSIPIFTPDKETSPARQSRVCRTRTGSTGTTLCTP